MMRFEQHVYGRVAQGFRAQGPGYQLAATTESLVERPETVDALNRLSFCAPGIDEGPRERYSLFRPALGWMALGCARMAKDRSGAVGSFAHNLVCSEDDFIASGASPVTILRGLTFFASEADLPADRRLPPCELDRFDAPVRHPEWNAAALDLIDIYLGESAVEVPMIVLDAALTWHLLDELFSLLPRQEAARLTFSTLFVGATDYLDAYRLVAVPGRSSLPRDEALYRIVEPMPEEDPRAARRQVPFTRFWRSQPQHGATLCRWADLMRHSPDSSEIPSLLDKLLATSGLRSAAEGLGIKGIYGWLVQKPEWMEDYHRAGGALDSALLREAVRADPQSRLFPAIQGAQNIGAQELIALLFEDLGRGLAAGDLDTGLVARLEEKGHLSQFLATVSDAHRFNDEDLMALAGRLGGAPFYRGQLHHAVARRVLFAIETGRRSGSAEQWIAARAGEGGGAFFAAVAALVAWRDSSTWRRKELRLRDFEPLLPQDYSLLLRAAWTLARRDARTFVDMAFREDARESFFASCSHFFSRAELDQQRDLLAALAGLSPWGTEHNGLIHAILASPKAHELSKHYARCLERSPRPDMEAITRLRSVRPPESWLFRR